MSKVKLVWLTPDAENVISYCARVSSPQNQENYDTAPKLINYCVKHGHYSILEMANMCVEIETSRAISAQIVRHRSFSFQEFSQRYAQATSFQYYDARRQDTKNRQNSIDDMPDEDKNWFLNAQNTVQQDCEELYREALDRGIAKEQARFLLPLSTTSKLYMNGTIRSWVHYVQLREANGTQLEHQEIALQVKEIIKKELPVVAEAMGWLE